MKNIFLKTCYISNILLIVITIMLAISYSFNIDTIYNLIFSGIGVAIRGILVILSIILWIYCLLIWAKFDKKTIRIYLLLFLNGVYVIFYYRKIKKKKWIYSR